MAQNKNKKFRKPIGTAKKTGDTEAWPWERKSHFCQSDTHPWHVCLDFEGRKGRGRSHHTLFTYGDRQTAWLKVKDLNLAYKQGFCTVYLRNWKTNEKVILD